MEAGLPPRHWSGLRAAALGVLGLGLGCAAAQAEVRREVRPETGLKSWTWIEQGVSLELVQRLPDQTRAFFLARGFAGEEADLVGRACVFQTIFRNDGARPVAYDLSEWAVLRDGGRQDLRTREHWDRQWRARDVSQPARIAFRWSLLPTVQGFEPGDYNWGMTSFGLPPGQTFDLFLRVTLDGVALDGVVPEVLCAPDREVDRN